MSFAGSGWSKFCVKDTDELIFFDDSVNLEDVAEGYLNPVSACGMMDCARNQNAKCGIMTSAQTNIGKMFIKMCQKENFELICITRN